jgi:energy-coupling factor transporter ATP-binding protein EcfA2
LQLAIGSFSKERAVKHTLEMRNIVKRFPGVLANNNVSLTIQVGEIHALLGENGAGKSTLMQILYGFHAMDSGEILIDGEQVRLGSPKDAIALGIVIFGRWNPLKAAVAAVVFGACDALQLSLQIFGTRVPPQLLLALPYIVTILAISGLFGGKAVQPAALMAPYVKD